jgi:PAS domain S-box-containing protein
MASARILVVEDEWLVSQGIKESLQDLGYEVTGTVASGEEALELAADRRPDLVLMDILLRGDMDGIDAAELLRQRFQVPVVFLTAYADPQTLGRAKVTEPYGYLLKPFEVRELHSAVEIALYKSQAEKRLHHLNQVLRAIRSIGQLIVQEKNRDHLIKRACQLLTDGRGYLTAWLALLDENGRVTGAATAGPEYLATHALARLTQGDIPSCGRRALLTNGVIVVADLDTDDCVLCPWRVEGDGRGALVTSLVHGDVVYGALGVQMTASLIKDEEEIALFRELAEDLSLALYKMDLENREQQALRALQTSEQKYRQIVETANEGIWVLNRDLNTTFINRQMASLMGCTPEEMVGKPVTGYLFPEDLADHEEKLAQRRQGQCGLYERRFRTRDGREVWTLVSGTPLFDEDRSFQGTLAMFMDITERKRAEAERLKIDKLEALGLLAGGIAHDLNNVLMGILGNINLASGGGSIAEIETRLGAAEAACGQAQTLAQHLLTFAKGGTALRTPQNLRTIVHEAGKLAVCGSESRIEFSFPEDLWEVKVDRGQTHQVFSNLFINAIQAMPCGGRIKVLGKNVELAEAAAPGLAPGKYVAVAVADEGQGIDPQNLQRIFDPYFTTKNLGTGLGLATAYAIVGQHGGLITVDSEPGRGTCFNLFMPAWEGLVQEDKAVEAKPLAGHGRILVVDDDALVREVVSKMLVKLGYDPVLAQDGREALALYTQAQDAGHPFAAVILDLTIPGGMGGVEAAEHLLARDPQARTVVSSGYADHPIMVNYRHYGLRGAIAKPYKMAELSKVLHQVTQTRAD